MTTIAARIASQLGNDRLAISRRFERLCDRIGHAFEEARSENGADSYFTVPDLDGFRRLVSADLAVRRARAPTFFNPVIQQRRRLGQGLHDRGEATVFAIGSMSEDDEKALAIHLPLHFRGISVAEKVIPAGETWDVSVRGDVWGLDDMEELYVVVNVGRLVLEPGAALIVRGNVFVLACDEIEIREPARHDWQIGILPTPHSVDYGDGPMRGADGAHGSNGRAGKSGRSIDTEGTFLGLSAREDVRPDVLCGADGEAGAPGGDGGRGRNGGACKLAELTFGKVTGNLTVFSQAGPGGDGGDGGDGGHGGDGGNAVAGPKLYVGKVPDGVPGRGGRGGNGGDGGRAGGGGIASNIYVSVPEDAISRVRCISLPSEPGLPGRGGQGGRGGTAGVTQGTACQPDDSSGGEPGRPGARGRGRPAPWMFLNEWPQGGMSDLLEEND